MDDLIPTIMFAVGDIKKQWDIQSTQNPRGFVWTAIVEDAKLGIQDQFKKNHVYIFEKGAKVTQIIENNGKLVMTHTGLKKIEYSK